MSRTGGVLLSGLLAVLCAVTPPVARAQEARELRRFALFVAANDGGSDRPRLKHAVRDAQSIRRVLTDLGGVAPSDAVFLTEPTPLGVREALRDLSVRLDSARKAGRRRELLFYFSGHSDEYGLLLGRAQLSYADLRAALHAIDADVQVAILDSCASGAFTREKGGKLRAPFLVDGSSELRGHVFLTSASEDEAAQESDAIGGSFFTHFLVSGLRGAADASDDGKVTITEAYRYAFDATLAQTGRTRLGAQHPAYDIRLVGTGDLVLTDLRETSAELYLAADVAGRLFVRDAERRLMLEVDKPAGKTLVLGLPQGRYGVELSRDGEFFMAPVQLNEGGATTLRAEGFAKVQGVETRARGARYRVVPAAGALVEQLSSNRHLAKSDVLNHFNASLLYDRPAAVRGAQLSFGAALTRDELRGLGLAPLATATGRLSGVQIAGVSYARDMSEGLSLAAAASLAGRTFRGMQGSLFTFASRLDGLQLGALNTAHHVRGVQLGAVNVATSDVRGVQVGVVNYARRADVSIAPIAITEEGGVHVQTTFDDAALLSFALRLDATYNYSFVSVRVHPMGDMDRRGYAVGAGVGGKLPLWQSRLWAEVDLSCHVVQGRRTWTRGVPNSLYQLRGLMRYELHKHFSIFAGPVLNVLLQRDPSERVDLGFDLARHRLTHAGSDVRVLAWPGLAAGLRF